MRAIIIVFLVKRIDIFLHLPTSNPLTEIAVKTISIVIITPILYIIGISMNWIRLWPNVRPSLLVPSKHSRLLLHIQNPVYEWLDNIGIISFVYRIIYTKLYLNLKFFTLYAPPLPPPLVVDKLFESVCIGIRCSVLGNGQQFGQFAASSWMAVSCSNDTNTLLLRAGEQRCTFWKSRREQRARHRPTNRPHYRTGCDDHVALFIDTAYSIEVREFSRQFVRFLYDKFSDYREKSSRDECQESRIVERVYRARTSRRMIRTNGHGAVPTQKRIGLRGGSAQHFEFPPRGQFGGREPRLEHFFFLSEVEVRRFEIYIYVKNFISTNFIRYVMKRLIILREILFSRVRIFRKEAIQRRGRRGRLKIGFENYRSLRASLEIFLSASSVHHVPLSTHRHCPTIVRISPNRDRAIVKSLWPVHNHSRCEFVEKKGEKKEGKDFSFLFYFNF